jgi:hypothetical protein
MGSVNYSVTASQCSLRINQHHHHCYRGSAQATPPPARPRQVRCPVAGMRLPPGINSTAAAASRHSMQMALGQVRPRRGSTPAAAQQTGWVSSCRACGLAAADRCCSKAQLRGGTTAAAAHQQPVADRRPQEPAAAQHGGRTAGSATASTCPHTTHLIVPVQQPEGAVIGSSKVKILTDAVPCLLEGGGHAGARVHPLQRREGRRAQEGVQPSVRAGAAAAAAAAAQQRRPDWGHPTLCTRCKAARRGPAEGGGSSGKARGKRGAPCCRWRSRQSRTRRHPLRACR